MRIAAVSDLHYPRSLDWRDGIERFAENMEGIDADVFAFSGDLIDLGYRLDDVGGTAYNCLSRFDHIRGRKVAALGNHDIWVPPASRKNSADRIGEMKGIYHEHGFHLLDTDGPLVVGDVAFVGNVGWYDYSFFPKECPPRGPRKFIDDEKGEIGWEGIDDGVLSKKMITYVSGGRESRIGWGDGIHIRWKYSDKEMTKMLNERLRADIESVYDDVSKVVVVTHHVPFESLVYRKGETTWDFNNAFMGSRETGELLLNYEKAGTVICGHVHRNRKVRNGHIDCHEVSFHPARTRPVIIEV